MFMDPTGQTAIIGYDGYGKPIWYMPRMVTPTPTPTPTPSPLSSILLLWPVKNKKLNRSLYLEDDEGWKRNFGLRTHPITGVANTPHKGIDIGAKKETKILAVAAGKVIDKFYDPNKKTGAGNALVIEHDFGNGIVIRTNYYHMYKASNKNVGDDVYAGEEIGGVGSTGGSDCPHLHFGVSVSDKGKSKYIGINGLSYPNTNPKTIYKGWYFIDPLIFSYK